MNKNNNLLISIITPTYNSERTIQRTIDSVLYQTYQNIEYVIVDGGSRDQTLQIISDNKERFINKGIALKVISEIDKGISDAFNKGIKLCTGDVIGIINSDDWLEKKTLQIISEKYDNDYAIYCGSLNLYDKDKFIKTRKSRPELLWLGMYIMHPTVFVKKEVYNHYNFNINLKISMDLDFILNATKKGKFRIKNIPLILCNMELGGISSDMNKMKIEERKVLRQYSSPLKNLLISLIKKTESIIFKS